MAKKPKKQAAAKAKKKPAKKATKKSVKKPVKKAIKKTANAKTKKSSGKKAAPAGKRKPSSGPTPVFPWRIPKPGEKLVGIVDDFYSHLRVITLTLTGPLDVGDNIHVRGHTTDIEMAVTSMQSEHKSVENGKPGMGIGIRIEDKARRGDYVYKVAE